MTCPKCGTANAEGVRFCTNCHATLIFKCPKCDHTQAHGGVCDACGANFAVFWVNYLIDKSDEEKQIARDKIAAEMNQAATVAALPLAGGPALGRFLIVQIFQRLLARFRSR